MPPSSPNNNSRMWDKNIPAGSDKIDQEITIESGLTQNSYTNTATNNTQIIEEISVQT